MSSPRNPRPGPRHLCSLPMPIISGPPAQRVLQSRLPLQSTSSPQDSSPSPTTHLPSPGQSSCQGRACLACTQGCGIGLCIPPRPPGSPSTRSAASLQRLRCFCSFSRDLCDRKRSCLVQASAMYLVPWVSWFKFVPHKHHLSQIMKRCPSESRFLPLLIACDF